MTDLAVNQGTLYAGEPYRFKHFRKTYGYANMPLDGIWLRAPYLHNGSVPTLRDLLEPRADRRECSTAATTSTIRRTSASCRRGRGADGRKFFRFDTTLRATATAATKARRSAPILPRDGQGRALEYLKTF